MKLGDPEMTEDDDIPANPDNEYGWEKFYAERVAVIYGRHYGMEVRVARFENCYGPLGTWRGGRKNAPAAICRKVAEAKNGNTVKVWGDGSAVRNFTYVDDLIDGVFRLIHSGFEKPINIGTSEYVTVDELVDTVIEISGKKIKKKYVEGPVGVQSRNFSKKRILSLGWAPKVSLKEGIDRTYRWINEQVKAKQKLG